MIAHMLKLREMSQSTKSKPDANELRYFVDGMDCASCAKKIENLVSRTPGAREPKVSFGAQTLRLELDETRTPRAKLEANIRALGYTPSLQTPNTPAPAPRPGHGESGHVHQTEDDHDQPGHDHGHDEPGHDHGHGAPGHVHALEEGKAWYATKQARLVFYTGVLLAAAWVFGRIEPQVSTWGYIAATVIGVLPLARRAIAGTRFGNPWTIETLVTLAAIGAIAINEAPEAAVVVFFFMIGELLEGIAAGSARAGIKSLSKLTPKTALLLENAQTKEVPADALRVGQFVRVTPGARVPADGTITAGSSSLDDSPVTGESVPVNKTVGDGVFAGSINTDGVLDVRVDKSASDNTIARIIKLVEEAEDGKGQTARFIDRFSHYWTPGVVLVSALVAVLPPLLFGGVWHDWLYKGVSLLLIGCPCALVLSVPAAITSGLSTAARRGILIKGGGVLETIGSIKTIAFDKTGTLTAGKPRVTDVISLENTVVDANLELRAGRSSEDQVLALAAAVEASSSHPLAKAIVDRAKELRLEIVAVTDAKAIQGKAALGTLEGRNLAVGSPKYASELSPVSDEISSRIAALEQSGKTVVVLMNPPTPLGLIAIRDEPRDDARRAIADLKNMGISSVMLTGDNARTGQAIASSLGLEVRAELMPEDKLKIINQLKSQGQTIAMIGDGINDAPALAAADVGIAMGGGTDVALETADAALLRNAVTGVTELVQLSRATMGNIWQNIAFALGLKAIFLVTTMLGLTSLWMAILADTGATAIVTANALRLLRFKPTI
jgi:Zn2+/Cd2+-exporting ATPase